MLQGRCQIFFKCSINVKLGGLTTLTLVSTLLTFLDNSQNTQNHQTQHWYIQKLAKKFNYLNMVLPVQHRHVHQEDLFQNTAELNQLKPLQ
jgi:hypothetical protein